MTKRQEIIGKSLTCCSVFILPMCNINYKTLPKNFINSYLHNDDEVVVVFNKHHEIYNFHEFIELLKTNEFYVTFIEDNDEYIFFFKLNDDKNIISKFKEGKYSEFDNGYKKYLSGLYGEKTIPDSYHVTEYNVLYPQDFKKKQIAKRLGIDDYTIIKEVFDKPDLDKEIYKSLEELIQLQETNQIHS